jgi:NAD(P)-dependent dehydrogenase (short-subunit alcohol dehydrogenase family)
MKTWLITGASRGFGARIAQLALERGDNVVATARNATLITDKLGERSNLLAVSLDVTSADQARQADSFDRIFAIVSRNLEEEPVASL